MKLIRHFVSQILKNLSLHFWHKKKKIHIFIGELHFKIDKKSPRFLHWHDTCYHDICFTVCPKKCIKPKNNIPHRDLFWKNLTESIKRSQNFLHNFFFLYDYLIDLYWNEHLTLAHKITFWGTLLQTFVYYLLKLSWTCHKVVPIYIPTKQKNFGPQNKNDSTIIKQICERTEYINTVIHWARESKTFSFILLAQ